MQWDALRLVIGTLRWYILLSVICCCAGVVGVLRSQLLLSRLFVIHSFLDFLLSTLSLFALAIVCTYPLSERIFATSLALVNSKLGYLAPNLANSPFERAVQCTSSHQRFSSLRWSSIFRRHRLSFRMGYVARRRLRIRELRGEFQIDSGAHVDGVWAVLHCCQAAVLLFGAKILYDFVEEQGVSVWICDINNTRKRRVGKLNAHVAVARGFSSRDG